MAFKSALPPYAQRPKPQLARPGKYRSLFYFVRENLSISTWILLGALLQSVVVFIIPRVYAFLPALLILVARFADTIAITLKWKKNPYLQDAILSRTSPQVPDADGNFHNEPAEEKVAVFMLGAKSNHPLGIFAPGMDKVGEGLTKMFKELNEDKGDWGFWGGSVWTNQDERGATEFLYLSYWRSTEDIHKFAYGETHKESWDWWNKNIKSIDHIGINHEIFEVDRKNWEAIYVNFQPTLLGASTFLRKGDKLIGGTVEDQWISPLVDASKGKLRSSAGRLGRDPKQLYDQHGLAPGATYED